MSFLDNIEQIIAAYPVVAFGAVFLAGVLSSASPCVLATIPLVVGFVGGYAEGDRWKAFRYSLAFIFGLSLTFTAFGAAAGLLGTMFGTLGGWWYVAAGAVAVVMGLQMIGLYEIRLPVRRDYKPKRGGMELMSTAPERLTAESRASLLEKARQGEVIVIDVRPEVEYHAGHLPFARSMPLSEIERRLAELPPDKEIVAYCRVPFCLMSEEAVGLLRAKGFRVRKITDGVAEWAAEGLPIEA